VRRTYVVPESDPDAHVEKQKGPTSYGREVGPGLLSIQIVTSFYEVTPPMLSGRLPEKAPEGMTMRY